jgi:hypothetical protein
MISTFPTKPRLLTSCNPALRMPSMLSFPKNVVVVQPGQGRLELSPVLTAMGIRPDVGMGAIRFSLGRDIAIEEIDAVVDRLTDVLAAGSRLTAKSPGLVEGTGRCSL